MSTYRPQFTARIEGSPTRHRHVRHVSAQPILDAGPLGQRPGSSRGHYVNRKLANKSL